VDDVQLLSGGSRTFNEHLRCLPASWRGFYSSSCTCLSPPLFPPLWVSSLPPSVPAVRVSTPVLITGCTFLGNSAGSSAGGVWVDAMARGNVSVTNCTFTNNTAVTNSGGALGVDSVRRVPVQCHTLLFQKFLS